MAGQHSHPHDHARALAQRVRAVREARGWTRERLAKEAGFTARTLARLEGHGSGTKSLSLFTVPKYDFGWETGELGERTGVYATALEDKMGG